MKFRAWDKINKKWVGAFDKIKTADEEDFYWGWLTGFCGRDEYVLFNDVLPFVEIVQYTGLKDKNGVEIYEGDIIKYTHYERTTGIKLVDIYPVEWNDDGSGYSLCYGGETREVIGNIFENPELLDG